MAIIYTYPTKATPNDNDLILISDSEDSNKTKQVKISTLPGGSGSGVSSVTAISPLASTGGGTPAISLTGLTGFGTTGQVIKVNSNADGLEWGAAGGSTLPSTPANSVQFNNAGAFGGSANLTFTGSGATPDTLAVTHTVDIKGDGTNAGKLKLYCENTTTPHAVTIEGPAHNNAAAYTLKLPSPAPANNQILQYTTSGNLGWINTPTGSGGVGTFTNAFGTYITGDANSTATGNVDMGTIDLSASGTATNTTFLRGDNTWATPPVSTYTNANNNYILTSSGTGSINGESSLLYSGSILTLGTNSTFQGSRNNADNAQTTNGIIELSNTSTVAYAYQANLDSNSRTTGANRHIIFRYDGSEIGYIRNANTNTVVYSTSASDERKKKNIVEWDDKILESFSLIEPKKFNYLNENDSDELTKGFIAQKMVDKFPEAYPKDPDTVGEIGYYSFNPSGMTIYLMKAIKELKEEIDTLKSRISTLEG